jgi:hypothetical protein
MHSNAHGYKFQDVGEQVIMEGNCPESICEDQLCSVAN